MHGGAGDSRRMRRGLAALRTYAQACPCGHGAGIAGHSARAAGLPAALALALALAASAALSLSFALTLAAPALAASAALRRATLPHGTILQVKRGLPLLASVFPATKT